MLIERIDRYLRDHAAVDAVHSDMLHLQPGEGGQTWQGRVVITAQGELCPDYARVLKILRNLADRRITYTGPRSANGPISIFRPNAWHSWWQDRYRYWYDRALIDLCEARLAAHKTPPTPLTEGCVPLSPTPERKAA